MKHGVPGTGKTKNPRIPGYPGKVSPCMASFSAVLFTSSKMTKYCPQIILNRTKIYGNKNSYFTASYKYLQPSCVKLLFHSVLEGKGQQLGIYSEDITDI